MKRIVCQYSNCRKAARGAVLGTPYCEGHGHRMVESHRKVSWGEGAKWVPLTADDLLSAFGR